MSAAYAVTIGFALAGLSAMIVHTALYHGKILFSTFKIRWNTFISIIYVYETLLL
jgi:hypothetical protein